MSNKLKEILIVVFGGMFGLHKFLNGQIGMGLLYMCTGGLFGIGWISDIVKVATGNMKIVNTGSLMGLKGIIAINNGEIPTIEGTNLNLEDGEVCCYMDNASTFKDKTITTGYTGKSGGVSIRIAKGISYRTGGGGSKAIRKTERTIYNGVLYITTKRVIYTSQNESFDKTFDKITSVQELKDGILIQICSKTYSIITKTHSQFMKIFNKLKEAK